ncbi:DUF1836 domain-containing protein [Bacillota bacterium Meth-B3]
MDMKRDESVARLCEALRGYQPMKWSGMPDLELYMDQVITYLKRQLSLFQDASGLSLVTPSIINNYVKDSIVPRPVNKRYAREQLSALTMACILKRVLPMQRVGQLIVPGDVSAEARYEAFCENLTAVLEAEAARLSELGQESLEELAMEYALRASADCLIADRLLAMLGDRTEEAAPGAADRRGRKR